MFCLCFTVTDLSSRHYSRVPLVFVCVHRICSLCLNQHRIIAELTPDQLAKEFGERVTALGRVLPMLEDWRNPGYVKRAWCLFEVRNACTIPIVGHVLHTIEHDLNLVFGFVFLCFFDRIFSPQLYTANRMTSIEVDM